MTPKRICSIDECERAAAARGWCTMHWQRWKRNGDPRKLVRTLSDQCKVEGCERSHYGRALCKMHYTRWKRNGDPLIVGHETDPVPADGKCTIDDCDRPYRCKGYCAIHYRRWRLYGDPHQVKKRRLDTPEEVLEHFSERKGECLVWTGTTVTGGYGRASFKGESWLAHRLAWTLAFGEIPAGKQINHICWNTSCIEMTHLQVVTPHENAWYRNGPLKSNRSSGFRNVHRNGSGWIAQINKAGVPHRAPTRHTLEEAVADAAALRAEHFGEFAGRG